MQLSVVIPVNNEADNVVPLLREVTAALDGRYDYEVVFVDDGSTDETASRLKAEASDSRLRVVRHGGRSGQSAAIHSGVEAARAGWIATLDGDGQNDPADIPRLIELAWRDSAEHRRMVGGLRQKRRDTWSRRAATRFANWLRQRVLNDGCPDTGCGLKVFPRDGFLALPYFDGQHRFLPALFQSYGYETVFEPVNHRPRVAGRTKYTNLRRALIGIRDLFGVAWLRSRTRLPPSVTEE